MTGGRWTLSIRVAAAALGVLCLVAYWNGFWAELLMDNRAILLQDPRLRAIDWRSIHDILTRNYWWPQFESDLFRPVTTLTYWFNYSVLGNGANPFGYHLVNLALHWLNVVLVFALVRAITARHWVALFTAAVVATHPLSVESVTNIVGRADVLAAISTLAGLLCYRRFLSAERGRRAGWVIGLGTTYALGVFCKESAGVLPGLMLLHDIAFGVPTADGGRDGASRSEPRRGVVQRSVLRVWPAYVATVPGVVLLLWARWSLFHASPLTGQFASDNPIVLAGAATRLMTAVKVIGYYLMLLIWPAHLSCDYSYNQITLFGWTLTSGQDWHAWLALLTFIGLMVAAVVAWRRHRAICFFLGFAAAAFLPVSNLLFPIGTIMAERLMYLPLVGMVAAAALTASAIGARFAPGQPAARHNRAIAVGVGAVVLVVALGARTVARNEDWTSNLRLWSSAVDTSPDSYRAYAGVASAIMESDPSGARADEALQVAMRGLRIVEAHPLPLYHMPRSLYTDIGFYNLKKSEHLAASGHAAEARAATDQAVRILKRAVEMDHEINRRARETLLALGRPPEAIHDIGNPVIYRSLGSAYLVGGNPDDAIAAFSYMQHIQPANYDAHYARGYAETFAASAEQLRGNTQQAEHHLELAAINLAASTILDPDRDETWQLLARVDNYLAPSPAPIALVDGRRTLNRDNPVVASQLQRACSQLAQQMAEAGMSGAVELPACR